MDDAHFHLHSWASNNLSLQETAVGDGTADSKPIVNVLALKWNPSTDLSFPSSPDYTLPPTVTARHVLQISSKIYDPFGLVSPVTVKAKLLIQELWQNELEWDEPLPPSKDLQKATSVSMQRRYLSQNRTINSTTYIHVFVDACPMHVEP